MSKYFATLFLLAAAASACQKDRTVYCSAPVYVVPSYLSFVGYTPADLHTIMLSKYEADQTFSHLLKSDTLVTDSLEIRNDTAYQHGHLLQLTIGLYTDYEVALPDAARTVRITGLTYRGDTVVNYTRPGGSCHSGSFFGHADSCAVDGIPVYLRSPDGTPPSYLFLQK